MIRLLNLAALMSLTAVTTLEAAERAGLSQIEWVDLIDDSKQSFEDPFKDLSYDQMDDLVQVVRLRERLERSDIPDEARDMFEARLAKAQASLDAAGIDVDWLISQRWIVADRRKAAATAGNPALDGQEVKLAGFAIAAPPDPDGASVVYLVPERGMCSHIPPPAPNQMVRVRLETGWTPRRLHEPVRLSGTLTVDWSEESIFVVDGPVEMRASFALDAIEVEQLSVDRGAISQSDGAARLAEHPRAPGHVPDVPVD